MQTLQAGNDELSRLERVAHNRTGLWASIAFELFGLLLFVAIFNFLLPNLGDNLAGVGLILLGLIFSLVPAALWLIFFYRMDRLEPEPKRMVFNVFLIALLVAGALHGPILQGVFGVDRWLYSSWWAHLFGGILVVAVVEQFMIYGTVRFSVFDHPEFDERVDGVIYAVAAGLGLATVLNFSYVLAHGGVDLDIGSIRMVVNALAYASFAGILGYFIGQSRFEKVPFYYLPMGFTLAAALHGLFFFLLERSAGNSLHYNPWGDLIFAAIVAGVTLAVVFWLVARANEETLRLAHMSAQAHTPDTDPNATQTVDPNTGIVPGTAPSPQPAAGVDDPDDGTSEEVTQ